MADSMQMLAMVITTLETATDASTLARSLVDQSLAACVQIDGPITSHYRWAGKAERKTEFRMMIKTSLSSWPRLKEKLLKQHPYEEPEIVMFAIDEATDGYRDWVVNQTG